MLNLDSRSKSKMLWIGTLLVPAIAVQVVRFMLGDSGPSAASAATPDPAAVAPVVAATPEQAKPLSPAQAKAVAWLRSRPQTLGLRSPMDFADDMPPAEPEEEPTPALAISPTAATPIPTRVPGALAITAIMSGGVDGAVVSINHKLYRIGDEIVPNWRILAIDARERTVTVQGPEGQSLLLSLTITKN